MVFISRKKIKDTYQYYIEHSFRLPNGKIKKISIYLKDYDPKKERGIIKKYTAVLKDKEKELLIKFAGDYYKPSYIFKKELIQKLEEIKVNYHKLIKKLTKQQLKDVLDRFTVNFIYESNAIEGNSLTLKDVTVVLHENVAIKGKDLRDIYETKNTRLVVELIFKNKFKITKKDIINMHKLLVKDTGVALGFKKLPNYLLMRNVQTTAPEHVEKEMDKLIEWYHSNPKIHPLEKAAVFHSKFEKIHPFEDGNGRVGRMLINIILLLNGYPPLIIRKTQRISYFHALEAFDNGHEDKFKRFLIDKYKDTYKKFFEVYVKYI